jgi:hypothetical protein
LNTTVFLIHDTKSRLRCFVDDDDDDDDDDDEDEDEDDADDDEYDEYDDASATSKLGRSDGDIVN